jgi:cobalt-zinc-cadmium efflux system protein
MNGHRHHHSHAHGHEPHGFGLAFAIGTGLNIALVVLQIAYGIIGHSVALLADAGHNFGDVIGLLLAWGASAMARRPPSSHYTYGLRSTSILAALANAIILLIAVGAIALEAIQRFGSAEPVAGKAIMIVAAIGILINGGTALLFMRGQRDDLNIRGAFLHMAADAGISLGVLVTGLLILTTGWLWLDPLVSLVISAIIVWGTWGLLRDSVNLALNAVPAGIDPKEVRRHLECLHGVARIHDLHIWPMSTTETALTCHLVMPAGHPGDAFIAEVAQALHAGFGIQHTTLQIECSDVGSCALAPDHVL